MSELDYHFVHNNFKLNGFNLNEEDLCRIAYSFIKEGETFERAVGDFILDWFSKDDFITIKTSGTTGVPKLIKVEKQAMVNSAIATGKFFDLDAGIRALHCLPTQYVAGKMMLVRAFILGWELDLVEPSLSLLERGDTIYNFAAMVPLQAQHSYNNLHKIKKIILGGAKVNQVLSDQLSKLPSQVYETYGMTETVTHIAAKKIGEQAFTVLPNVNIEQDERQCLVIDPYVICKESIITNDIVDIVNENQFIWLGRYDNVINSGGVKLFPEQIEEKLSGLIDERYFVKGISDEKLGEKLVLIIEGNPYEISQEVFSKLDKFEKPKDVLFVEKFEETASGKVIRNKSLVTV
ncbi:MAG: O-succinylbenzoic acid--CoA ligase [Flavobacterium sp. MedPE-SWcel]|uniref:AMP-binding protein n=1 Tax=uncultured Flavobacterium sp. TaxID=165435 RepID=UPI0009157BE2|nr:AMP-binding protein [uncultured Flavobacterium sp.]OIQ20228.1 MAG: O-succinylbenzoic acid--CoA ligase [Flavobacterium sp. MedPE-SWcel]